MKTKQQLIKEIEDVGVFIYKDGKYLCTGYDINDTIAFVDLHKSLTNKLLPKLEYKLL